MRTPSKRLDAVAIKQAIDPRDFYLRELNLCQFGQRSGEWAVAGLCPFHQDKSAGSFKVNLNKGAYRCWSCGAAGGDVIDFIKNRDGLSFIDALRKISYDWRLVC